MANPSTLWDRVPVYGFFFKGDDRTPLVGRVRLTVMQRVTRTDGRRIYAEGATVDCVIGDTDAAADVRDRVRDAWREADQVRAAQDGVGFDGAAWDAWWGQSLLGAVFTSFPASDDPDIVQTGYQVKVEEQLSSNAGKVYFITPRLTDLDASPPGLNLGLVDVPPGAPTAPAPIYMKGRPGGVAALDGDGDVVNAAGEKVVGGGTGGGGVSLHNLLPGRSAADAHPISAVTGLDAALTAARSRANHTGTQAPTTITGLLEWVQDAVADMVEGVGVTPTYNDATGKLTLTVTGGGGGGVDAETVRDTIGAALRTSGLITVAVNDAGDTITIGTTATANSSDAQLRDRATHTGTQPPSTITGLPQALTENAWAWNPTTETYERADIYAGPKDPATLNPPPTGNWLWIDTGAGTTGGFGTATFGTSPFGA